MHIIWTKSQDELPEKDSTHLATYQGLDERFLTWLNPGYRDQNPQLLTELDPHGLVSASCSHD